METFEQSPEGSKRERHEGFWKNSTPGRRNIKPLPMRQVCLASLKNSTTYTTPHNQSPVHLPRLHFMFIYPLLFFFNLFICLWLCWVFVSVRGLSLVAASGGHPSSRCTGLSLSWPLLLQSTGSRRAGSVIVAHGPSCSAACGIFPDQGSNPCPLNWQADSQPLRHQGSPIHYF